MLLSISSQVAQWVKNSPVIQETWVQSLGREDPLEEEMAALSSILAWRIPWTEEPGWLQSIGSQGVGCDGRDWTQRGNRIIVAETSRSWFVSSARGPEAGHFCFVLVVLWFQDWNLWDSFGLFLILVASWCQNGFCTSGHLMHVPAEGEKSWKSWVKFCQNIYVCITESFWCTREINTML